MKNEMKPIVVIGAGIVGVSTALWLQNQGKEVVLVDKALPGNGASMGNADYWLSGQWFPLMLLNFGNQPKIFVEQIITYFFRLHYFPKLLPWLIKFMANATKSRSKKIIENLTPLVKDSVDQHKSLVKAHQQKNGYATANLVMYIKRMKLLKPTHGWKVKSDLDLYQI